MPLPPPFSGRLATGSSCVSLPAYVLKKWVFLCMLTFILPSLCSRAQPSAYVCPPSSTHSGGLCIAGGRTSGAGGPRALRLVECRDDLGYLGQIGPQWGHSWGRVDRIRSASPVGGGVLREETKGLCSYRKPRPGELVVGGHPSTGRLGPACGFTLGTQPCSPVALQLF